MQALLREISLWGSFLLLCKFLTSTQVSNLPLHNIFLLRGGGGGLLPYKGLMGMCSQPGYVFRDFCLQQGIDFIPFCLNQGIDFIPFCLNQGIDFINLCLKHGIFS